MTDYFRLAEPWTDVQVGRGTGSCVVTLHIYDRVAGTLSFSPRWERKVLAQLCGDMVVRRVLVGGEVTLRICSELPERVEERNDMLLVDEHGQLTRFGDLIKGCAVVELPK